MDQFALLKIRHDVCQKNLTTCESSFQKALESGDSISWYQDPNAIVGFTIGAFALGFVAGFAKK